MKGSLAVKKVTGAHTIYPGHPLVLAWEIMSTRQALGIRSHSSLLHDNDISGGRGEVIQSWKFLKSVLEGADIIPAIELAEKNWVQSKGGGHSKSIVPGQAQAAIIKEHLAQKFEEWAPGATKLYPNTVV